MKLPRKTAAAAGVESGNGPLLDLRGVAKTFLRSIGPIHAVHGINLAVVRGSFTAVLGASGSGKTTVLRVIAGVERPDRGMVAIDCQQIGIRRAARDYDDAARGLGRSPVAAWLSVTAPLALPAVASGAMLVLLSVSKELTMTLLLRPTGSNTLVTKLWTTTRGEVLDFTAAAPYAIGMLLVSTLPAAFLARAVVRSSVARTSN